MSNPTDRSESPVQTLSLAVDFYNRYPGETVTFFFRFTVPDQAGTVLQFAMPRALHVQSYQLPDGIPMSLVAVSEVDQDLIMRLPLDSYFRTGQLYEITVQVQLDDFYFDHHIHAEARLLDATLETISTESVRVTVRGKGKYLEFLPELYDNDDFTSRFMMLFESFWKPVSQQIDQVENYFDPDLTPQEFLPWLSSWIGLPVDNRLPVKRMRNLLNHAMYLFQRRGTLQALQTMLEIYTEGEIEIIERRANNFILGKGSALGAAIALGLNNKPNAILIRMRLPWAELERMQFTEEMYQLKMKQIIRGLIPAHTTFDLDCEFYTERDKGANDD